jgi:hypothetical protein
MAPRLERLELAYPKGFDALALVPSGAVLTCKRGSRLVPYDCLADPNDRLAPTASGLTHASPDGRWLGIQPAFGPCVEIYELPGLGHIATLTNQAAVAHFQFSPLSDQVAIGSRAGVEIWSTTNWQRLRQITNFTELVYSPDPATLWLATGMRFAGLYGAHTTEAILPLPTGTIPLAVSPDRRHLAVSVDARRVQLWDLAELRGRLRDLGLDWGQAGGEK